jgi:transposase
MPRRGPHDCRWSRRFLPGEGNAAAPAPGQTVCRAIAAMNAEPHRDGLRARGTEPVLAQRGTRHGGGLGVSRGVVERTRSWWHQSRRPRIRYARLPEIHEACLTMGCALIGWRCLSSHFVRGSKS